MQLIDGIGCWIHEAILTIIKTDWCENRNGMIRALLLHLIREEKLGEYTACGSRDTKSIPLEVRAAVHG